MNKMWTMVLFSLAVVIAGYGNASAARRINGIGNDFAVYDATGVDITNGTTWYSPPQRLRLPVGLYNLNPTEVAQELTDMRASGETDIALPIWNLDFGGVDPDGITDWVYGERIDNSLGQLRPQHQTNLINLLTQIKNHGFQRVIVRFFSYWPGQVTTWNESEYQKNWNFVMNTRNLVEQQLAGSATTALYDIGAEMGGTDLNGHTYGVIHTYVVRLWEDYTAHWGNAKTVGFSFAWGPGKWNLQKQWYDQAGGVLPSTWAFDIYPVMPGESGFNMVRDLTDIANEMGSHNGDPIIVLETWPNNDPHTSSLVSDLTTALGDTTDLPSLNLDGVFEWTMLNNAAITNQLTTTQISAIRPLLATRRVDITNSATSVESIADVNCATQTSGVCSIYEKWGTPPAGQKAVISIKSDANPTETLHECVSTGAAVTDPWIGSGSKVYFIVRYQTSCTLTNATPNATSTIFVHTATQP